MTKEVAYALSIGAKINDEVYYVYIRNFVYVYCSAG